MGNGSGRGSSRSDSVKLSHKMIERELSFMRKHNVNNVEGQHYSLTEQYPCFSDHRGTSSLLDLCVLANRPTKDFKILRKSCQDDAAIVPLKKSGCYVLGVFDGHGPNGERVSQMCTRTLLQRLSDSSEAEEFLKNPKISLNSLIQELHSIAKSNKKLKPRFSGTTATISLLNGNILHLSWVGDSRAVIFTTKHKKFLHLKAFDLTQDHDFSSPDEVKRIESKGGIVAAVPEVESNGPLRIWHGSSRKKKSSPGLAMSKSIGDLEAHKLGCCAEADYMKVDLKHVDEKYKDDGVDEVEHCIVVLASDGVWDAMPKESVAKFLSQQLYKRITNNNKEEKGKEDDQLINIQDEKNLSLALCLAAQNRWLKSLGNTAATTDDISAITMVLY